MIAQDSKLFLTENREDVQHKQKTHQKAIIVRGFFLQSQGKFSIKFLKRRIDGGRGAGIMAQINNAILNEQTLATTQLQQISGGEKRGTSHKTSQTNKRTIYEKCFFYY